MHTILDEGRRDRLHGRVHGKVAFITGAARGQGRSHAVRLAEEGADIVAFDICEQLDHVPYPMPTKDDLDDTKKAVEAVGGTCVTVVGDVRNLADVTSAVNEGIEALGHLDIVLCNAGAATFAPVWEISESEWAMMLAINLTGVWHTIRAALPPMIEARNGGSIVITSSTGGSRGIPNSAHYVAAKHGVVGLMRDVANEVARFNIRVNTVHPTGVNTTLIQNDHVYKLFRPELDNPTQEDLEPFMVRQNLLKVPWIEPIDVSNAILWLTSDEARYVTGETLHIDAGFTQKVH